MVNFSPLTAEIGSTIWGTPANFNWFRFLERYCTASSSWRQLNFAALNKATITLGIVYILVYF